MGCDFYIYTYLEIEHTDGVSYYEFPYMRGYYRSLDCSDYDSDDDENDYYYKSEEYKELYNYMIKIWLKPKKPVIIYDNHSFVTPKFEMKYLPKIRKIINNKYVNKHRMLDDIGTLTSMEQIIKITKKEYRYDPLEKE
jgi:hypothetical protein